MRAVIVCVMFGMALARGAAGADPAALAPVDAAFVVAAPSVRDLDKAVGQLITSLELRSASTLDQVLAIVGLGEAVDQAGPALAACRDVHGAWGIAIPLRAGFDAAAALGAVARPDGLFDAKLAGVSGVLALPGDGRMVFSQDAAVAAWLAEGGAGAGAGPGGLRGALGDPVIAAAVAGSPVVIMARPDAARGLLGPVWGGVLGGGDFGGVVATVRVTGLGVSVDALPVYPSDSPMRELCAPHGGGSGAVLRSMPATDYLAAGSIALSHPFFRDALKRMMEEAVAGRLDAEWATTDEFAFVCGTPAGWPGSRRLAEWVAFRWAGRDADDSASVFTAWHESMMQGGGGSWEHVRKDDGAFTWLLREGPAGVPPYAWLDSLGALGLPALPGSNPPPLLGTGRVSETGGRAVVRIHPEFADAHMADPTTAATLGGDAMLAQLVKMLPEHRDAELYVNTRPLLEAAAVVLAPGGEGLDLPEWLPPVGMVVDVSHEVPRATVFVPMGVLRGPAEFLLPRAMGAVKEAE